MACGFGSEKGENGGYLILVEAKTFQQTRERTFLPWPSRSYPCRMKMKEAGWFIVREIDGEFVAVCLYCKKAFKGWSCQYDPYKVHQVLSSKCVFVLYAQNIQIPSSPIVESLSRREEVRPSSHPMAELPKRTKSFEQWPPGSPQPSTDDFVEAGLFYTGQNTVAECFFCHGQMSIFHPNADPMLAHTNRCKYAGHLTDHAQRGPLNIRASNKVYGLEDKSMNNITFYFLRSRASTCRILLSALINIPSGQESEIPDKTLKRLRPSTHLGQRVNWATSSDGPLVHILRALANNAEDLRTLPDEQRCLIEDSSISSTNTTNDLVFQCKTCLTNNASPHIVPTQCGHPGLCSERCFSKWMTCVICGYTLGRAIRIYSP